MAVSRHLIAVLALVVVVGAASAEAGEAKHPAGGGVTTLPESSGPSSPGLESSGASGGWQWPGSDNATSSFTSLAVIKDGALTQSVDSAQNSPVGAPGGVIETPGAATIAAGPAKAAPAAPMTLKQRISRLPEPGIWALMLIGVAMIGFAIRGLVAANRRLARLSRQEPSEKPET